ncbi:MAG: chain-length determining protein [Gammaproteobacteria bacterium]|nr:MAG: chain-length determining protein [Gammaproteobacteria bacterium]
MDGEALRDILERLRGRLRAAWHQRWHALTACCVICALGWFYVLNLPDLYRASARVYVETQSVLQPLLQGLTVETDVLDEVQLMTNALRSRPVLERLAEDTGLAARAGDDPRAREVLLERMRARIAIRPDRDGRNLYWIEFLDPAPAMAEKLVTTVLDGFVESVQGNTRRDSSRAQDFLEEQIRDYEARLAAAEDRLKTFKLANIDHMPDARGDYYQRLQQARGELDRVELELSEAEQALGELDAQVAGELPTFGFGTVQVENQQTRDLDQRINQLRTRLDELLLQYTERHPDVAQIRDSIARLEAEKVALVARLAPLAAARRPEFNPVYQQLETARGAKAAEVAALRVRRDAFRARVAELDAKVDKIPAVEAELAQLNRDYDVVKRQYETLLARREAAHLTQRVEEQNNAVQFKVIDPPRVDGTPSWPRRRLFNTLVLLVGVFGGLAVGYFKAQLAPVFFRAGELAELGVPVYGSVPLRAEEAALDERRLRARQFAAATLVLAAAYAVLMFG